MFYGIKLVPVLEVTVICARVSKLCESNIENLEAHVTAILLLVLKYLK